MIFPPEAQINSQGQVALRYYQPAPTLVRAGDKDYYADVRAAISLAWVDPDHVAEVLEKTVAAETKRGNFLAMPQWMRYASGQMAVGGN
jgi:hypothetical protein